VKLYWIARLKYQNFFRCGVHLMVSIEESRMAFIIFAAVLFFIIPKSFFEKHCLRKSIVQSGFWLI
jgi:hypothetical protein